MEQSRGIIFAVVKEEKRRETRKRKHGLRQVKGLGGETRGEKGMRE